MNKCRLLLIALLGSLALSAAACTGDGHIALLGYTSRPNYDERYRTVYVPIFESRSFQAGPLRGLEYLVTSAVQKQIEQVTPYKVVSYREGADTELLGAIVMTPLGVVNRNQLNEIREGDQAIQVELLWRDLRTGEVLSAPRLPPGAPLPGPPAPGAPGPRVALRTTGRFVPELGESQSTALQRASQQLAVQIVSLMENSWSLPNP